MPKHIEINGEIIERKSIESISKIIEYSHGSWIFFNTHGSFMFNINLKTGRYITIRSESYKLKFWTDEPKDINERKNLLSKIKHTRKDILKELGIKQIK